MKLKHNNNPLYINVQLITWTAQQNGHLSPSPHQVTIKQSPITTPDTPRPPFSWIPTLITVLSPLFFVFCLLLGDHVLRRWLSFCHLMSGILAAAVFLSELGLWACSEMRYLPLKVHVPFLTWESFAWKILSQLEVNFTTLSGENNRFMQKANWQIV